MIHRRGYMHTQKVQDVQKAELAEKHKRDLEQVRILLRQPSLGFALAGLALGF